jgi:hypothetical protein
MIVGIGKEQNSISVRIKYPKDDELGHLGSAFNDVMDRLEEYDGQIKEWRSGPPICAGATSNCSAKSRSGRGWRRPCSRPMISKYLKYYYLIILREIGVGE